MAKPCVALNKRGHPCSAQAQEGSQYCRWHDPALEAQRREWNAKGGRNRANKARARKSLDDETLTTGEITGVLSRTMLKLEQGDIHPGFATAIAGVAKALDSIKARGELEARVAELETRVGIVNIQSRRAS